MIALARTADAAFWADAERHLVRYGVPFSPAVVERASGSTLHLADGREVLDFTSGQMSAILGHGHPEVVAACSEAVASLGHLFSGMLSRPVVELARRLAATLPDPLERTLLLTTGAEANEAALRLAKLATGGHEVVSFSRSWHGMTQGAAGATYSAGRAGAGPAAPGNFCLPTPYAFRPDVVGPDGGLDWRTQLELGWAMVDAQSTGALAACIVEPILSSGGIVVPPPGYLAALAEKCSERGMLLVLDEAQTGLGRTGLMYAFEHDGVVPDVLTLSKTLGAGLPVAAVVTSAEVEERAHERGFLFYTTHVSDPLAATVALTVLDVLEREDLVAHARDAGGELERGLRELQRTHDVVGDIRGRGLLLGLELALDDDDAVGSGAERLGGAVTRRCLELGLHVNVVQLPGMGGTLRIAPALTTTREELARGLDVLDRALADVR